MAGVCANGASNERQYTLVRHPGKDDARKKSDVVAGLSWTRMVSALVQSQTSLVGPHKADRAAAVSGLRLLSLSPACTRLHTEDSKRDENRWNWLHTDPN